MSTKHTPGPWVITESDSDSYRVGSEDFGGIAFLHDPLARDMGRAEGLAANARLIAAAPDLLAALRRMMLEHESLSLVRGGGDAWPNTAAAARAAIAKAEG